MDIEFPNRLRQPRS